MYEVKLPYYPKVNAMATETRFGAVEVTTPRIYEEPIAGKFIVRVDTLTVLKERIGEACFAYRELVYAIVAGTDSPYDYRKLFASFYKKYPEFRGYVNDLYFYGDTSIPIIDRVVDKLRELITGYRDSVASCFDGAGGKYLLYTHDFIYYAFRNKDVIPKREGLCLIC